MSDSSPSGLQANADARVDRRLLEVHRRNETPLDREGGTELRPDVCSRPEADVPACNQSQMMPMLNRLIIAALSFFVASSFAQDAKFAKAEEVVDALQAIDGRAQVKLAVDDVLRNNQEFQFRAQYEEFFTEVLQSPEYRTAKATAFARAFSVEELDGILALAQTPAFRKYQEKSPELMRESRAAFSAALGLKIAEFARRIETLKATGPAR